MGEEKEVAICRVCLNYDFDIPDNSLSLFEEYNDYVISDKINVLTNVGIKAGDGLPDRICPACLAELESAYSFKLKCEKTNEILLSAVTYDSIKVENFNNSSPTKEEELVDKNCDIVNLEKEDVLDNDNTDSDTAVPVKKEDLNDGNDLDNDNSDSDIDLPIKKEDLDAISHPKENIDLDLEGNMVGIAQPISEECQEDSYNFYYEDDNSVIVPSVKVEGLNDANFEVAQPHEVKNLEGNNMDIADPIKEDNQEDYENVEDHNMTPSALLGAGHGKQPQVEMPRLSKAIDLKLECHDCGGSFKSKCKLRVHWKRVHLLENIKCPSCLKKFKSYEALNSHKKRKLKSCVIASNARIEGEGKNRVFHCKECDYKTRIVQRFVAHTVTHTGERSFQCDMCPRNFTQKCSLIGHMESAHNIYRHAGTCHFCGKYIKGLGKFNKHIHRHKHTHNPCTICNAVLTTKANLKIHMQRHSDIKAYACDVCGLSYKTSSSLSTHKKHVHLKTARVYNCEICNYTTRSHSGMAKHKPKHSNDNIACDICGFFVDNERQLAFHKKRHTDKRYQCTECEKKYYKRDSLSSHLRKVHGTGLNMKAGNSSSKTVRNKINCKTKNLKR